MDKRAYLKVKVKSLAEEAKIIRLETKRAKQGYIKRGLYDHRMCVVRPEARHTHLAYGFLRGRECRQIEQKAHTAPDWKKVRRMVEKYGSYYWWWDHEEDKSYKEKVADAKKHLDETLERFDKWVEKAQVVNEAV